MISLQEALCHSFGWATNEISGDGLRVILTLKQLNKLLFKMVSLVTVVNLVMKEDLIHYFCWTKQDASFSHILWFVMGSYYQTQLFQYDVVLLSRACQPTFMFSLNKLNICQLKNRF